jgi:prepilin-type N-terminal cleavage/methylation domain-containing protein
MPKPRIVPGSRRHRGFSLIELFIAMVIMAIIAVIGFPALHKMMIRSHLEGATTKTALMFRQARHEAITQSVPVVANFDVANKEIFLFADMYDAGAGGPGSDLIFNPQAGATHRTTDYVVGRLTLPSRVEFITPIGLPVNGFTGLARQAVFLPNGSIRDEGAVRFGDTRGNFLEAQVAPAATARIEVRKWDPDDAEWYGRNEGGKPWKWYI